MACSGETIEIKKAVIGIPLFVPYVDIEGPDEQTFYCQTSTMGTSKAVRNQYPAYLANPQNITNWFKYPEHIMTLLLDRSTIMLSDPINTQLYRVYNYGDALVKWNQLCKEVHYGL